MYNVHSPNLFKIPKQKFQEYKIQNYILKTVIIFHAYLMKLNNIYLTIKQEQQSISIAKAGIVCR